MPHNYLNQTSPDGPEKTIAFSSPFSWKTLLFLPQFAFKKARDIKADCFIVDFQDAVPLPAKAAAREGLRLALQSGIFANHPVVVRINENALPGEQELDLDAVVGLQGVAALMPTMTENPEDLEALHIEVLNRERKLGLKEGDTKFLPLIETPAAILHIDAIAKSGGNRNIGLLLGHGDLFRLSGGIPHPYTTMDFPRNAVLFAARAAGIPAFDTPYTNLTDLIGLERSAREAKTHGFDGKACIHFKQISTVRRCMLPTAEEITWAHKIENARQSGLLDTLREKLNTLQDSHKAARSTDGMALVNGLLVGPPHIKTAQAILQKEIRRDKAQTGRIAKVIEHKSDSAICAGATIGNPYELTITDGMIDLWLQSFYCQNPTITSISYAAEIGKCLRPFMPVPFTMGLYLCVSMADTHGAIYHLGFRNAMQLHRLQSGDTVRQKITVLHVRNTKDGKRSVVTTLRELINTETNRVVFTTEKLELYPAQPQNFGEHSLSNHFSACLPDNNELLLSAVSGFNSACEKRKVWEGYSFSRLAVEIGDVLLHTFARPLGITANLSLSTRFLVTHPIHLDHHRFDQENGLGIVVSGGLVISLIIAAASRDFSEVIWEELLAANNIRTVSPNETVSAFSVVLDKKEVPDNTRLESLLIKTIGVKNMNPAADLANLPLPEEILAPIVGGGSMYDDLCEKHKLFALEGNIVGEVLRKIVRRKPSV